MTTRARRTHGPGCKAKLALAAMKDGRTLAELAKLLDVHPHQITAWKARPQEQAAGVFGSGPAAAEAAPTVDLKMIDRANVLPLTRQASLLRLSRSSICDLPRLVPTLMRRMGIEAVYRRSGRATPALRDATASERRAGQPAGQPPIGPEAP